MTDTPKQIADARAAEWNREPSQQEIDRAVANALRPALLLNMTRRRDDPGASGCWVHGEPRLPADVEWPHTEVGGMPWPLFFLAQFDLASIPWSPDYPNVPKTGTLFFFYEPFFSTSDAKVIYAERDVSTVPSRSMPDPEYRPVDEWSDDDVFEFLDKNLHRRWNFEFMQIETYAEQGRNKHIDREILDAEIEANRSIQERIKGRWSGSEPIPWTMSYLFGSENNRAAPAASPVLLLTMSGTMIYNFWIDQAALDARDFDKVVMTIFD